MFTDAWVWGLSQMGKDISIEKIPTDNSVCLQGRGGKASQENTEKRFNLGTSLMP